MDKIPINACTLFWLRTRFALETPCFPPKHVAFSVSSSLKSKSNSLWKSLFASFPALEYRLRTTVQAIRNKPSLKHANSHELFPSLSEITNFMYKVHMRIRVWIRENERKDSYLNFRNSCTNFEGRKSFVYKFKQTRLHQGRNSKTSYFDNFMVSFWKVNISRLYWSFQPATVCQDHSSSVCKLCLFVYLKFSLWLISDVITMKVDSR